MTDSDTWISKVFIVGPTESLLTMRGNRHPALAKFLVEKDYELEYLTSNFYHADKRWFSSEEIEEAKLRAPYKLTVMTSLGYKRNISPRRILSNLLLSLKFCSYLFPRLNKRTILILPSRPVEMIFGAAMLRLFRRTSVALDIQDVWPDMLMVDSQVKKTLFTAYCNIFLYPSLRFINKFFHVAPSFVCWLNRFAPKAESVFIPLGFDAGRWSAARPKNYSKNRPTRVRLVCVAQLTFQFDILPLLKALRSRGQFELKVIGEDGKGERYAEVVEFASSSEIRNFEIIGSVDREIMVNYLKESDVGIVPMVSASIPNKVFDYVGSYLPMLVLGENDSSEFVKRNRIGWSSSFDERGIGDFLDCVTLDDIEEKSSHIASIRSQFDRDVLHEEILHLIESDHMII